MFIIFFFLFTVSVFCGILGGLSQSQEQFKKLFILSFNVSIILFFGTEKGLLWRHSRRQWPILPPKNPKLSKTFQQSIFSLFVFFFLMFYFALEYSQLTTLLQFQVDSKGTEPHVYMSPFSSKHPSHPGCHVTLSRVPCAIPQILSVISLKYNSVFTSAPDSLSIPFPIPPPFLSPCSIQSFLSDISQKWNC